MNREEIFSLTQALLALVVVIGSGVLLAFGVISSELVTGLIGVVLGYYFGSATAPNPLNARSRSSGKGVTE